MLAVFERFAAGEADEATVEVLLMLLELRDAIFLDFNPSHWREAAGSVNQMIWARAGC